MRPRVGLPEDVVETVRKPTTGLKLALARERVADRRGRDGQKTHDGIETQIDGCDYYAGSESRRSENPRRD